METEWNTSTGQFMQKNPCCQYPHAQLFVHFYAIYFVLLYLFSFFLLFYLFWPMNFGLANFWIIVCRLWKFLMYWSGNWNLNTQPSFKSLRKRSLISLKTTEMKFHLPIFGQISAYFNIGGTDLPIKNHTTFPFIWVE